MEDWRIRVSVLWIVFECGVIVTPTLEVYIPGLMELELAQMTPVLLLTLAITMMIAPIMAFLSLTLKDSVNRWANIIAGVIFAILVGAMAVMGLFEFPAGYGVPLLAVGIVQLLAAGLIVWYSWKSKSKG